jgi:hypothetical protein
LGIILIDLNTLSRRRQNPKNEDAMNALSVKKKCLPVIHLDLAITVIVTIVKSILLPSLGQ